MSAPKNLLGSKLDLKNLHKLADAMKSIGRVKVGIPEGPKTDDGISQARVAATHEFGSPKKGIPERPFLRPAVLAGAPGYAKIVKSRLPAFNRGGLSAVDLLGLLGEKAKADVQMYIGFPTTAFAPLSERTIARKGSTKPLIDTGNMRQSITYVTEPK